MKKKVIKYIIYYIIDYKKKQTQGKKKRKFAVERGRKWLKEQFAISFTISKIIFSSANSNFKIIKGSNVKLEEGCDIHPESYIIKGNFISANEGDRYEGVASWEKSSKYGYQLAITTSQKVVSKNKRSIKKFLVKNIPGIGTVTAGAIVDKFGSRTFDVIKNEPEKIAEIKGVGKKKSEYIQESIVRYFSLDELSTYLFERGFTNYEHIMKIYEKWEDSALPIIKENPYMISTVLPYETFPTVDSLALANGYEPNNITRLNRIILYYLSGRAFSGDSYVYRSDLYFEMYRHMIQKKIPVEGISQKDIDRSVSYLEENGQVVCSPSETAPIIKDKIYLTKYYRMEADIVEMLNDMNKPKPPLESPCYDKFFEDYKEKTGIELSEDQKLAVRAVAENKLSILTGLAGAGKTSAVKAIVEFIKYGNPETTKFVLCAPTGRAAKRITEVTGSEAVTIHRLLGIKDDNCKEDEINPISPDYLLVDESSMIDLELMYLLLKALKDSPATSLIMVGDENQLPPVGIGFPFKDIISSGKFPHVKLTKLFRQAKESQININANLILENKSECLSCDISKQDFFIFDEKSPDKAVDVVSSCYKTLLEKGNENPDDIVILSPMRKTPLGSINLNKVIQNIINPSHGTTVEIPDYEIRQGDRVMQTINNYDKEVFNGDIGKVKEIDSEKKMVIVVFDDFEIENGCVKKTQREVSYMYEKLPELTLAYAMTIHKSQGSEFPCVIIPSSSQFYNMSKNLAYTAITRAKKRVIICGDVHAFYVGMRNTDKATKNSGLLEMLVGRV